MATPHGKSQWTANPQSDGLTTLKEPREGAGMYPVSQPCLLEIIIGGLCLAVDVRWLKRTSLKLILLSSK